MKTQNLVKAQVLGAFQPWHPLSLSVIIFVYLFIGHWTKNNISESL